MAEGDVMATDIHKITVDGTAYVNLSQGNLNICVELEEGEHLRCVVGDSTTTPDPDTDLYLHIACPIGKGRAFLQIENLAGEADLWMRLEDDDGAPIELKLLRGDSRFSMLG